MRRNSKLSVLLVLSVLSVFGASCTKKNPMNPGSTGTVVGIVTAADGVTRIGFATVSLASTGTPSTTADVQGAYTLGGVPTGSQSLRAKKGNFEILFTVNVTENATTTAPTAKLASIGKLAFVPGIWDSIQTIVRDQLGNPMDQLTASQLGTTSTLNQYRMIFLNCGLDTGPAFSSSTIAALLAWVRAGGTLYASDYAMDYVQAMLPGDIQQLEYSPSQTITATVSDAGLQSFIGKSTASIRYDLSAWIGLRQISSAPRSAAPW